MKDNFSTQSDLYAKFRPQYPQALFDFLKTICTERKNAWDCGTGNGQVAVKLAEIFDNVLASDISASQLENAAKKSNITYSRSAAEQVHAPDNHFDLVVVAQAIHWFDFDKFYAEVRRTSKPGGHLVVTGYGLFQVSPEIDRVIADFYENVIGKYWDPERRYIDELYKTIPFPFKEIAAPAFSHQMDWAFDHLLGYLRTWSAVKHYEKEKGNDPVALISEALRQAWGDDPTRNVNFPILLRIGSIDK